ncbi:hypothetical protein ACIQ9I_21140 [Streptomyces sp. NPDC094461]|uniref:hypothetical protein n=1 Tax=Streptomyces sp. NPDC094461 TaxID=3366064 RepID=UPI0037F939B8
MSYERDLKSAALGMAWPCHCGDSNPPTYDACHTCQTPSWDCACRAVNCTRDSICRRCHKARGFDMAEDDEYLDCDLCDPADGSEPYPYAHCCGCGADGSSERPDCTCE